MDGFERDANESAVIALMRAGNYGGAEARVRTMLAANPNDARALALLAQCRFEDEDKKAGLEAAREAARLEPDDPLVKSTLIFALQRAGKGKKDNDDQLQLAEDAAAHAPDSSEALFDLAIARQNSNAYRKAKGLKRLHMLAATRDLVDDAERFADDAHELINVAWLRLQQWDFDAADALAQRAMLLDPTQAVIFTILAECALARKQPADAYDLALEALRLSPGDPKIMRLLTRARVRTRPWLRPFAPLIDWIMEMDRLGLVVVPLLMIMIGFVFATSLRFDLERMAAGLAPAVVLSAASGLALVFVLVSYLTAAFARVRIRHDLRRLSLPRF